MAYVVSVDDNNCVERLSAAAAVLWMKIFCLFFVIFPRLRAVAAVTAVINLNVGYLAPPEVLYEHGL